MRLASLPFVMLVACGGSESSTTGPYFQQSMFFNEDVSDARVADNSGSVIAGLSGAGGWGRGNRLQIDFSFDVLEADASSPRQMFTPLPEFFYSPDCDAMPVPLPLGGNLEGETGYECKAGGDCHLIVHDREAGRLYEMYRANVTATEFHGGCLAVWETSKAYGEALRGDQCSSADAAGFPIAPMLFTADEVAAGEIAHAIRFVLPNDRVRRGFVRPAVHGTDTDGPLNGPPYGVHLRLRADYPLDSLPNEGARVVARALQKYGMIHADGGEVALTAASDRFTTAKWAGLLSSRDLEFLKVEDFEVIDHGPVVGYPYRCSR